MSVHRCAKTKKWYVKYRLENGKQTSRWFGTTKKDQREAESFNLEIKSLKKKKAPLPSPVAAEPEGMYLDELAQKYMSFRKAQGASAKWLKEWKDTLNKYLLPLLTEKPADQLTFDDDLMRVVDYYQKREASQSTINRYLGYLKAMFSYGVLRGWLQKNPMDGWKKQREQPRQSPLTHEDLAKIQACAPDHLAWGIEVAYNLVLRPGKIELSTLTWERVDWNRGGVWVWQNKTKRWKFVPCSQEFMWDLQARKKKAKTEFIVEYQGEPVKSFRTSWPTAVKKAKIGYRVTPYDIRHLAISTMLRNRKDPGAVADMAGHSTPYYTITRYHHVTEEAKRDAAEALTPLKKPGATKKVVKMRRTKG